MTITPHNANDDRKLGRGTAWVAVASGLSGVLDVITTVTCLWLWLSPKELGTATLAGALYPVLERFAGLGMPAAMVRQGDGDHRALSTMLWLTVASSIVVLASMVGFGRAIGALFHQPIIGGLLIGYGVKLVLQTVHAVPEALLRRELAFDALTRVRIAASFSDAAAKLVTAYVGAHGVPELGIWCFVIGPMVGGVVTSIGLQLARPWRPQLAFDRSVAVRSLRYGLPLSGGELLYFIYSNADYLVIGRVWGEAAVGAYRLAYELVLDVVRLISLVTAEVAFPAFARLRGAVHAAGGCPEAAPADDARASTSASEAVARAGALLVAFTRQNLIAVAPVVVFIAVAADDLLAVLYPPLPPAATAAARILCVVGALRMVSFVLPAMLAGLGHADDALAYHGLAALVLPTAFALAAWAFPELGYVAVAWAWATVYPVVFAVVLWRALARCGVSLSTYVARTARVFVCGGGAALGAAAVHAVVPGPALLRLIAIAAATLGCYAVMLTWLEHLTPRAIWRLVRGVEG